MKTPPNAPDANAHPDIRAAYAAGYRQGLSDGNPGRVKSDAKTKAARLNASKPCAPGKRRGRPRKTP